MAWMLLRLFTRHKQAAKRASTAYGTRLKRAARAICYVFNLHTLLVLFAACVSVAVCHARRWAFPMDFSMVSAGTVFPLTFTLQQAFSRRERATILVANLKASVLGLYYMHRDWDLTGRTSAQVLMQPSPTQGQQQQQQQQQQGPGDAAKALMVELLVSFRAYLMSNGQYESQGEARLTGARGKRGAAPELLAMFEHSNLHLGGRRAGAAVPMLVRGGVGQAHLATCYRLLSQLSQMNERLTVAAGYDRGGEGGLSRTAQYLRYIIENLEELRGIKEYRTPTMMRHACGVLIHIFAICLAPYYVHFCSDDDDERTAHCIAGYASAGAYVLITMLLYHVQQDLENCLDETGLDDVFFTVADELDEEAGGAHVSLLSAAPSCSSSTLALEGLPPEPGAVRGASGGGSVNLAQCGSSSIRV